MVRVQQDGDREAAILLGVEFEYWRGRGPSVGSWNGAAVWKRKKPSGRALGFLSSKFALTGLAASGE